MLQDAVQHMPNMLESIATCARFPQESSNYALCPEDPTEAVAAEEETAAVLEKRQDLFTLFKNTAKLVPEQVYAFVRQKLQAALSNRESDWQVMFCNHHFP